MHFYASNVLYVTKVIAAGFYEKDVPKKILLLTRLVGVP